MEISPQPRESTSPESDLPPETQGQRWLKYGTNVALSILLVIVIAVLLVVAAQRRPLRVDTTALHEHSLTPQTRKVLAGIKDPIEIISLYAKPKPAASGAPQPIDRAQYVSDLLDEYRRDGNQITIQSIDPQTEPGKLDELAQDLEHRYGKNLQKYREFLDHYLSPGGDYDAVTDRLQSEVELIDKLPLAGVSNDLVAALRTPGSLSQELITSKKFLQAEARAKYPDYAGTTKAISGQMSDISDLTRAEAKGFALPANLKGIPAPVATYMKQSIARLSAIATLAEGVNQKINRLGELKIKGLTDALASPNQILVLGPESMGWRILSPRQIWPDRGAASASSAAHPVFAGEQLITTAIYSLTQQKKPMVVFVRPDGEPLTLPPRITERGDMVAPGRFFLLRQRLEQYNFQVMEYDASGTYAMMAERTGEPTYEPDATADQLQTAVWVVLNEQPTTPVSKPIEGMLEQHLAHGGSALVLVAPPFFQDRPPAEDLTKALTKLGITIHNNVVAVHARIPAGQGPQHSLVNSFEQQPAVFVLNDFGPAAFAEPVRDLNALFGLSVVVESHEVPGVTVQPVIPIPTSPHAPQSWGDANITALMQNTDPTFDASRGDIPAPIYGGAAAERGGKTRVVAIGTELATNDMLANRFFPLDDPEMTNGDLPDPLFPGNGELAMNSIFWLSHLDSMISISPAIAQSPRIGDMSPRAILAWRFFLLIVMPLCAAGAGIVMYALRRS